MGTGINKIYLSKDETGQTLVEFILLLSIFVFASYFLLQRTNENLGERWTALVRIISDPTDEEITLR